MGFRAIARVTDIDHTTIINWVKEAGESLSDEPQDDEIPEIGENTRLRHYLARLPPFEGKHRKTLCYSKSTLLLKLNITKKAQELLIKAAAERKVFVESLASEILNESIENKFSQI